MKVLTSFRAEMLKISGRPTILLISLLCILVPLLLTLSFEPDSPEDMKALVGNAWNRFYEGGEKLTGLVFLPLYIIITCTLLPQIEYRNNTWKQVFASPQTYTSIYLSKYLVLQFAIIIYLVSFIPLVALAGTIVNSIYPVFRFFDSSLDLGAVIKWAMQIYIAVLAISTLQFVIAMRSKSFIIPIAIGFVLWITTVMLIVEYKWEHANRSPYSFSMFMYSPKYADEVPGYLISSISYTAILMAFGLTEFSRKKVRG